MRRIKAIVLGTFIAVLLMECIAFGHALAPADEARKQVAAAQVALYDARSAIEAAKSKLLETFGRQNPDYAKAMQLKTMAQADMSSARASAEKTTRLRPDYIKLAERKAALGEQGRKLQHDGKDPAELIAEYKIIEQTLLNMEFAAADDDPRYVEAKARFGEATRIADRFKSALDDATLRDRDYQDALAQFASAKAALLLAQELLKSALGSGITREEC